MHRHLAARLSHPPALALAALLGLVLLGCRPEGPPPPPRPARPLATQTASAPVEPPAPTSTPAEARTLREGPDAQLDLLVRDVDRALAEPRQPWVRVRQLALGAVEAQVSGRQASASRLELRTQGVAWVELDLSHPAVSGLTGQRVVLLDGQPIVLGSGDGPTVRFQRLEASGRWERRRE